MVESFQKQRRNLIVFSALVIFINLAGAKIERVNLLGNILTIERPDLVPVAFFLVLAYFFVRYFQYMHAVENKGFVDAFQGKMKKIVSPYLVRRVFMEKLGGPNGGYAKSASDLKVDAFHMYVEGVRPNTVFLSVYPKRGGSIEEFNNEALSLKERIIPYARSLAYVTFRTHLGTEYVFPAQFAAAAFASFNSDIACYISSSL